MSRVLEPQPKNQKFGQALLALSCRGSRRLCLHRLLPCHLLQMALHGTHLALHLQVKRKCSHVSQREDYAQPLLMGCSTQLGFRNAH